MFNKTTTLSDGTSTKELAEAALRYELIRVSYGPNPNRNVEVYNIYDGLSLHDIVSVAKQVELDVAEIYDGDKDCRILISGLDICTEGKRRE